MGSKTPIDKGYKCGFAGEYKATAKGYQCPVGGNQGRQTCDGVKRIGGYLEKRLRRPMVHGRHEEIVHRVKHMSRGFAEAAAEKEIAKNAK